MLLTHFVVVQPLLLRQMNVAYLAAVLPVGPIDVELLLGEAGLPQLVSCRGRDLDSNNVQNSSHVENFIQYTS